MSVNKTEFLLKDILAKAVEDALLIENMDREKIVIEIPKDSSHGDYSSNIAMQLTKQLKQNPRDIAASIVSKINTSDGTISAVEIAGPGFINLFINQNVITSIIQEVIEEQDYFGKSNVGQTHDKACNCPIEPF